MKTEIITTKEFADLLNKMMLMGYNTDLAIDSKEDVEESTEYIGDLLSELEWEDNIDDKLFLYKKIIQECLFNGEYENLMKGLELADEYRELCTRENIVDHDIEMNIAESRCGIELNLDINSWGTGNLDQIMEESINKYPESPLIFLYYMDYIAGKKRYDEYIKIFEKLDLETLNNARLYEIYIGIKVVDKKQSKTKLYTMLTKKIEENDTPFIKKSFKRLLAMYFLELDDYNEAIKIYSDFLNEDDQQLFLDGHWGYASCLVETQGKKQALKFLYDALKEHPEYTEELILMIKDFEDDDNNNDEPEEPTPKQPSNKKKSLKAN